MRVGEQSHVTLAHECLASACDFSECVVFLVVSRVVCCPGNVLSHLSLLQESCFGTKGCSSLPTPVQHVVRLPNGRLLWPVWRVPGASNSLSSRAFFFRPLVSSFHRPVLHLACPVPQQA